MEESKHEWDVVVNGTKQIFYCLVGDCAGSFTRSKLCGLNRHRIFTHKLPPIPQRPRGRQRDETAKRAAKSPSKITRQNAKIQYDVDARLCRARKQAYKRIVSEEIICASVATIEELNDASRQKIIEKMHGWDQSLPRRRMETTKRIQNDLQRKGKIVIYNDVEEEDLNEDSHILKSGGTNINNEFTPNEQKSLERSHNCEPLRRSPRFQGLLGEVLFSKPFQPFQTPEHGHNFEKNANEMDQTKEFTSPQGPLHGEQATPLSEIHQKSHRPQPLRRSPRYQEILGEESKREKNYGMVKKTKITPTDLKSRGFKSRKQYIEHICSTSIAATKPTRFATLKSKRMHHV